MGKKKDKPAKADKPAKKAKADKPPKKAEAPETESAGHPLYPGAHPTAPGGMSQKALRNELLVKHNYLDIEVDEMSWPDMIDAVATGRRQRELEAEAAREAEAEQERIKAQAATLLVLDPDTRDYRFDGHAGAGPSGSERWMNCTESLGMSRQFLETLTPNQQLAFSKANIAAREGTTAHTAAEAKARAMLGEITDEEMEQVLTDLTISPETEDEAYSEEMGEWVTEYVDLLAQFRDEGREILIEQRVGALVPLTGSHEGEVYEVRGSADAVVLPVKDKPRARKKVKKILDVIDLKYGRGIYVEVDENSQAMIYALGVLSDLADDEGNPPDIDEVHIHIAQPRLGGIRSWSISLDDLLDWRDNTLAPALTAALFGPEEGATFAPSDDVCQFCPARGNCPALAESVFAKAKDLFEVVDEAEINHADVGINLLPADDLGSLLRQATALVKLAGSLKEEAQRRLYRGEAVPGFQLVSHTPKRTWKEDAVITLDPSNDDLPAEVTKKLWQTSLITPTQALKAVGKAQEKLLADLINVPDKYPVVAAEGDRRATWAGRAPEDMFAAVEEG